MNELLPYLLPSVMIIAAAMAALAYGTARRPGPTGSAYPGGAPGAPSSAEGRASEHDRCRLCASPCQEHPSDSSAAQGFIPGRSSR